MGSKTEIDVIILSYARSETLRKLTEDTIDSLLKSEDPNQITFNVLVLESNKDLKPFQFEHTKTIYPDVDFGYHTYMNIGIKATSAPYVCLCNNDLLFHWGWASKILHEMELDPDLKSANPLCPIAHQHIQTDGSGVIIGTIPGNLTGWCLFFKREILKVTGLLDEKFKFWYCDNDYGNTMAKYGIKHALVTSSQVTHIGSKTHTVLNDKDLFEYTYGQFLYYDLKWNNKSFIAYGIKTMLLPVFRFLYQRKQQAVFFMLGAKAMGKLYGGLK
jgi:GT2 family glycosyltransferase